MSAGSATVRAARPDDADAMGELHVRAWQHAYRGVMPDEYLDGLVAAERGAMWRRALSGAGAGRILVATVGESVVGFAAFGAARGETADGMASGELYAINLDPARWGLGIGQLLLGEATDGLASQGFCDALLWVVPQNARARRFYEAAGWIDDGVIRSEEMFGVTVTEQRYRRSLGDR